MPNLSPKTLSITAIVPLATSVAACAPNQAPEEAILVEIDDWELVDPSDDPIPGAHEHEPCPSRAAHPDNAVFEIDTDHCEWVTISAPLRHSLPSDHTLDLLFFHSALAATDPGRADVRLWIGEVELWHLEIPIPWGSGHHDLQLPAPESFAEGEPVYLHVSNHGANSYRFGRVYRRSEPGQ